MGTSRQRFPLLLLGRGDRRFGIPFRRIIEVIPLVELKPLEQTPPQVSGTFEYRGQVLPVIDLTVLLAGHSSEDRMDTRIVVVDVAEQVDEIQMIGRVAERVVDSAVKTPGDFKVAGSRSSRPYLGATTSHDGQSVQVIDVAQVIDAALRELFFSGRGDGVDAASVPASIPEEEG
jgi:chemotaxis-related protein WspB